MITPAELPAFETVYLEIQPAPHGRTIIVDELLELFRERRLLGVAVAGSEFGLSTPIIAKVAMAMIGDDALVYEVEPDGSLVPGEFTGVICEWLARSLGTDVVADEYVLYSPGKEDGAVEFIELDPQRQSIEQPAGFPNEWRVSPHLLDSQAIVFADGADDVTAQAIATDSGVSVASAKLDSGRVISMPAGVVELPANPHTNPAARVVLFAQAGAAKYAHLVMGKKKNPLKLTIANLPPFQAASSYPEGSAAHQISALITNAGLVAGAVHFDHPQFPVHILPLYQDLTDHSNTHAFFSRTAEALQIPQSFIDIADSNFELPQIDARTHAPTTAQKKRGWFRR